MLLGTHTVELAAAAGASREQVVQLFPAGRFHGRDGRGPYELQDAGAVIEATRRYAGSTAMPVDYDHALDLAAPHGQPAPAAGWIKGLQARADGIWGLVEWTAKAAAAIAAKEYRYISPAFHHAKDGRVLRITHAGLVNSPNFDMAALAAAETSMDLAARLRSLLGLPDDADDEAIVAAVTARKETAAIDPTQFVPIGTLEAVTAELARVNRGVSRDAAERRVETAIAAKQLVPALRDWAVELATVNAPALDNFIQRTAGGLAYLFEEIVPAHPPNGGAGGKLSADESAVAAQLGLSADEFKAGKGA